MMVLHGEENVELYKPITPDVKLVFEETLVDVADKKKNMAAVLEGLIKNAETGEVYAKIATVLIIRGMGGFGKK